MSLESISPTLLILLAAVLTAVAGVVSDRQRKKSEADAVRRFDDATALFKEVAGQTGDEGRLQEIITLRQRLLESNRPTDQATIDEILAKVPQLAADYRALRQNQGSDAERRLAAYRATWEPLIRFVIAEFEKRIAAVAAREPGVTLTRNDAFSIAGVGQTGGNSHLIRVATFRGVELRLYCVSARTDPADLVDGNLTITVRVPTQPSNHSNPLSLNFRVPDPAAPQATTVPQAMTADAIRGINQGITDLLMVGKGGEP